jgi:hypothetical protein
MGVTSTNLIQGPATLYWGAFGSTEPTTLATAPAAPFTDLGGTQDGVEFQVADDYSVLSVDQVVYEIDRRRTNRVLTVKTNLAEATLANLAIAINNTAPAAVAGPPATNVLTADDGLTAFAPAFGAVILDGIAPGGFRRRLILRKVLSTDSMATSYKKDAQTLLPVTFTGHWVSSSIKPFVITDATS